MESALAQVDTGFPFGRERAPRSEETHGQGHAVLKTEKRKTTWR